MHMAINRARSLGFTAFLSIISEGRERVVTAIMKESTTPSSAPLAKRASAIGIVPKISAYNGAPASTAIMTPKGLFFPKRATINLSGMALWSLRPPL